MVLAGAGVGIYFAFHKQPVIIREDIVIPTNLVGQHLDQAVRILAQNKLHRGAVRSIRTGSHPKGTVISTAPAGGSKVPAGSAVNLVVEE